MLLLDIKSGLRDLSYFFYFSKLMLSYFLSFFFYFFYIFLFNSLFLFYFLFDYIGLAVDNFFIFHALHFEIYKYSIILQMIFNFTPYDFLIFKFGTNFFWIEFFLFWIIAIFLAYVCLIFFIPFFKPIFFVICFFF